jgi:DNA invertase Pin-like site-specific DNA recombinase
MQEANEFKVHILAALAQQGRKLVSKRTKEILQVKKAQGIKLCKLENLTSIAVRNNIATRRIPNQTQ